MSIRTVDYKYHTNIITIASIHVLAIIDVERRSRKTNRTGGYYEGILVHGAQQNFMSFAFFKLLNL